MTSDGTAAPGSSESKSDRAASASGGSREGWGTFDTGLSALCFSREIGFLSSEAAFGAAPSSPALTGFSSLGVSSTVECFPVVHGGIERNSSKVKTRGLQQSQPEVVRVSPDSNISL